MFPLAVTQKGVKLSPPPSNLFSVNEKLNFLYSEMGIYGPEKIHVFCTFYILSTILDKTFVDFFTF